MPELTQGPPDATPLTSEERRGLRLPVLTRDELNLAEAQNIGEAAAWLFLARRRLRPEAVIEEVWLKRLHQRMFGQVWNWAGQYRTSDRNLGVPFWQVRLGMRNVHDDVGGWLADTSTSHYRADECAVRFGYRLVVIHPFPNGNGRWSRMASDALVVALGSARFTWGGASLTQPGSRRGEYMAALHAADTRGDLQPLMVFARS